VEDRELINEFLIESTENLARLDQEMVELEKRPRDKDLLSSVFRTIHTIKATCGFLGFSILERVTHHAENILAKVRTGEWELTQDLALLVLESVDSVKAELSAIERTGQESGNPHSGLVNRLSRALETGGAAVAIPPQAAPAALAVTQILLGEAPGEIDGNVCDALGELVNQIGGNLKFALPPGVQISIPMVVLGSDYSFRLPAEGEPLRRTYRSGNADFWLTVVEIPAP
jgi:two-component system chemotaxis sensor kinase CheA